MAATVNLPQGNVIPCAAVQVFQVRRLVVVAVPDEVQFS